ncbi:MAG: hypothetical protein Kow00108_01760 [Calditrichia bacterium]
MKNKHKFSSKKSDSTPSVFKKTSGTDHLSFSINTQLSELEFRKLYQTLFHNSLEPIMILEGEVFIDCNDKTLELFACNREDIIGKPPYLFSPEMQPDGISSKQKAIGYISSALNGQPQLFEWKHKKLNGELFDAIVNLHLLDLGERKLIQAIIRDITTEKQHQSELSKYLRVLETTPQMIVIADVNNRIVYANEQYLNTMGLTRNEVIGQSIFKYANNELMNRMNSEIIPHILEYGTWEGEILHPQKGGTMFPATLAASLIKDEKGQVQYMVGVISDIRHLKNTEIELRKKEAYLRRITENMTDIVWMTDLQFNPQYISPSVEKVMGYTVREYLQLNPSEMYPEEYVHKFHQILSEELAKERLPEADKTRSRVIEIQQFAKDGSLVDLSINVRFLRSDEGKPTGLIGVSRVITEQKQISNALQKLTGEFLFLKGREFFTAVSRYLSHTLNLDIVYVGKFIPESNRIECIGGIMDGQELSEFGYSIEQTPCQHVINSTICVYPNKVQQLFPQDELLKEMNVQGYVGVPVYGKEQKVLGLLVGLNHSPIQSTTNLTNIFNIFVNSIAAEMERNLSNEQLRISEEKFRTIFNNASDAIYIHDENKKIIDVNDTACRQLGYTREELIGMDIFKIVAPESHDAVEPHLLLDKKNPKITFESKHRRKDGTIFPVEVSRSIIEYNGQIAYLGVARDISERKKAEYALKESEEKFRQLTNSVPIAILMYQDDKWVYANPAAETITGYTFEELLAMDIWQIVYPEDKPTILNRRQNRLMTSDFNKPQEFRILQKSGQIRWVYLHGTDILYLGKPARLLSLMDITDQKRAEIEQNKLKEQLNQAQKMESIGRLAGGIAHDFNNMLGVILGRSELLLHRVDENEKAKRDIQEIQDAASRAADLTNQLLAFARRQTVTPQIINLNRKISDTLQFLRRLIGEDIELTWKSDQQLWNIKIDPSQLDQILTNLLVNARDAMRPGIPGKIELRANNADVNIDENHLTGKYVVLEVRDNGIGMEEQVLKQIFEPFFTTKKMGLGTGLGLSTVYGIVKQNDGYIEVNSIPDEGTTFSIYFPAVTDESAHSEQESNLASFKGNGETILLVEDEPALLNITKEMLAHFGFTILSTDDPTDAINLAEQYPDNIHLLITDIVMPKMNGQILSDHIKQRYPGIKVLFMSGYAADNITKEQLQADHFYYIQKPFTVQQLMSKVSFILSDRKEGE